eukprot:CAMPEP_0118679844 /NCGR_PEP_ID=MMETSP0800-20121206/4014_1 /TAXON_ID=210618 ORGANISM="Striatella unipunctata, Strain CCMP2910" /NCGR_SAMPLE_ID=MMETSP0800 /ASSEMBLY_ACC=CAM_ASM_000638 /LENGTH=122 /DNA_ID=CAMNT_0006575885 /DNA_START=9 /DNA_END=378 /DNA_ORIENTATION=+
MESSNRSDDNNRSWPSEMALPDPTQIKKKSPKRSQKLGNWNNELQYGAYSHQRTAKNTKILEVQGAAAANAHLLLRNVRNPLPAGLFGTIKRCKAKREMYLVSNDYLLTQDVATDILSGFCT